MRSERWLTRRAARGDRDAFAAIFRRHQDDLYRYCMAILGDPDDAQDVLQNTMVKALRALPGERREIALRPWLYRIAHNEAIDLRRRERPTEALADAALPPAAGPDEVAVERSRLRELLSDLGRLSVRQRGALVLRELAGFDFEQVGDALETSPAAARQLLYEARRGLREMGEGREMSCDAVAAILSAGDGRVTRRRDIRAHLRDCSDCRTFAGEIEDRKQTLAAISPLPATAAAALLKGALASAGGAAGGVGGSAGVGVGIAAKAGSAATAVKSVVGIVAIVTVGAVVADQAHVLHLGGGHGGSQPGAAASTGAAARPGARHSGQEGAAPRLLAPTPGARVTPAAARRRGSANLANLADAGTASRSEEGTTDVTTRSSVATAPSAASSGRARGAVRSASGAGAHHPEHPTHPAHPAHPARSTHAEHPPHPSHPSHPAHQTKPAHPAQAAGSPAAANAETPTASPPVHAQAGGKSVPAPSAAPESEAGSDEAATATDEDAVSTAEPPPGTVKDAVRGGAEG